MTRRAARLSDRVKRDEVFAFVEIPADVLDSDSKSTISYHSNHPGYRPCRPGSRRHSTGRSSISGFAPRRSIVRWLAG